ncbi:PspC domain-containing protein [Loigolactobacillus iwatensis]|uniref:PspC domain-containing protein n=1 Tax=Loigolactobacillus iwatensis TaxID=1267156 RepID=UPI001CDC8E52|nr:PspC domain-containing protein [Loigolactobacillus iwatensis]
MMQAKRLVKSNNRILSGVLGGIADYFNLDKTLVRLIYAAAGLLTGVVPAVVIYLILALVMADDQTPKQTTTDQSHDDDWSDF